MKIDIDREGCISCGLCVSACPEVYEFDEENIATVITSPVPEEYQASAEDAADNCPVSVILVKE